MLWQCVWGVPRNTSPDNADEQTRTYLFQNDHVGNRHDVRTAGWSSDVRARWGRALRPDASPGLQDSISVQVDPERSVPLDSASGRLTVEPSVAIHDSIIVVSWNDSHGGHIGKPSHDVGTAVSFDAGATSNSRGFLPRSPSGYVSGGDSRIVATPGGRFLGHPHVDRSGGQQAGLDLYFLDPPTYALAARRTSWRNARSSINRRWRFDRTVR